MNANDAERTARLWSAGKMIGGDEGEVREGLLEVIDAERMARYVILMDIPSLQVMFGMQTSDRPTAEQARALAHTARVDMSKSGVLPANFGVASKAWLEEHGYAHGD